RDQPHMPGLSQPRRSCNWLTHEMRPQGGKRASPAGRLRQARAAKSQATSTATSATQWQANCTTVTNICSGISGNIVVLAQEETRAFYGNPSVQFFRMRIGDCGMRNNFDYLHSELRTVAWAPGPCSLMVVSRARGPCYLTAGRKQKRRQRCMNSECGV